MNILIIGEYSGFAKNLKIGFVKCGHKVTILTSGDGLINIKGDADDINYSYPLVKILGKPIKGSWRLLVKKANDQLMKSVKDTLKWKIDVVFVTNYNFLSDDYLRIPGFSFSYLEQLKKNGAKVIMSCCGNDPALYYQYRCNKNNFPFFTLRLRRKYSKHDLFDKLINISDVIVPISYCYYSSILGYIQDMGGDTGKISMSIPLPIAAENYTFNSCKNRKIVIFHGCSRPKDKGTIYFKQAFKRLINNYPDFVECVVEKHMPYKDYIKLFEKIDILCDQTYGHGMGMNAAIGLMKGKVVLGGNSFENQYNIGDHECPIIDINDNSDLIYYHLEYLILHPEVVDDIKKKSREYAIKYLSPEIIAGRYISLLDKIK